MVGKSYEIYTLSEAKKARKGERGKISKRFENGSSSCREKSTASSPSEKSTACLDDVFILLGWMGPYQGLQCFLLLLPVVDCAVHAVSFIFIGRFIHHNCAKPSKSHSSQAVWNISTVFSNVSIEVNTSQHIVAHKCSLTLINQSQHIEFGTCPNGYEYKEPQGRSFTAEWNLVCEKEALSDFSQTIFSLGMMFGAFLSTLLADKFGRKPTYVVSHILLLVIAILTAISPDFATFLAFRFLLGALQQGTCLTSMVLTLELMVAEKRGWPSKVNNFVWSGGLLLLGLICFLCRDMSWRHTELVLAAVSGYALLQWWLVDESIRWLTARGKIEEAEKIIAKAARKNKVDTSKVIEKYRKVVQSFSAMDKRLMQDGKPQANLSSGDICSNLEHSTHSSFTAFVKSKPILKMTAIVCYLWFIDSLTYMSLTITSQSLTDDFFMGYTLNILAELPAAVVFSIFINRIGRRHCAIAAHLIAGVALLLVLFFSNLPLAGVHIVILISSLLAKFGISFGFAVLWLYTPELFATPIRTTGFGVASFVSRIGGMAAPYSRILNQHYPWVLGTVLSALCLTVPLMVQFLPETHGHNLPQTVGEMEQWLEDSQKHRGRKTHKNINDTAQAVEGHHF